MGHLGKTNLQKLFSKGMVIGVDVDFKVDDKIDNICEACITGKQTRTAFHKNIEAKSSRVLELIHSDVCGPLNPSTWNGKRYFVTFTDDFTHLVYGFSDGNKT